MTPAERAVVEQAIALLVDGRARPKDREWWSWRDGAERLDRTALATISRLRTLLALATNEPESHT